MTPKLAIIICSKDSGETLSRMFESLLRSADILRSLEIIFVNDGSTDRTLDIVAHYIKEFPFFKLVNRIENWGVNASMNQGLNLVESPWFMRLDPDDCLPRNTLNVFLEKIEKESFDILTGPRIHTSVSSGSKTEVKITSYPFTWIGCGVVINTQKARSVGGYRNLLWEEFDFYIRYLSAGNDRKLLIDEPVYEYFIGPSTITSDPIKRKHGFDELISIHGREILEKFGFESKDYVR